MAGLSFAMLVRTLSPEAARVIEEVTAYAKSRPEAFPEISEPEFTDDFARSFNLKLALDPAFEARLRKEDDSLRRALLELYCAASNLSDWRSFRALNARPAQDDETFVDFQERFSRGAKSARKYARGFERIEVEALSTLETRKTGGRPVRTFAAVRTLPDYVDLLEKLHENAEFKHMNDVGNRMYSGRLKRRLFFLTGVPFAGKTSFAIPAACRRRKTVPLIEANSPYAIGRLFDRHLREADLSESSVRHYRTGLNTINRLIAEHRDAFAFSNVFEPATIEELAALRDAIRALPAFVELNKRGNNMYSAALNHFVTFVERSFETVEVESLPDAPQPVPENLPPVARAARPGNDIIVQQSIGAAHRTCEYEISHVSFLTESGLVYMEGHHLIPVRLQPQFSVGLHVWANVVCLCPLCHRQIHYGTRDARRALFGRLFDGREARLRASGIDQPKEVLMEMACG